LREVNSFVNSIQRHFKDLLLRLLVNATLCEILSRIPGNIISEWSPFNAIICSLQISDSMLKRGMSEDL